MILADLLAFAWHSILDVIEPLWQAATEAAAKRTTSFADLLTLSSCVVFPSWQVLLESIVIPTSPPELLKNQKNRMKPAKKSNF